MRNKRWKAAWAAALILFAYALWVSREPKSTGNDPVQQRNTQLQERSPEPTARRTTKDKTGGSRTMSPSSTGEQYPPVDLDSADRDLDLFGIVVDAYDFPVAGATIQTVIYPWRRVSVLNTAGHYEEVPGPATRSARDGTFSLRLRRGEIVHLRAIAEGYARTEIAHCAAGEFVRVNLAAAGELEVVTVDERGSPVQGVRIRYWSRDASRPDGPSMDHREGITDENGSWLVTDLQPGRATLALEHDTLGSPSWQTVEIQEGEQQLLEVIMPTGRIVRGSVVDAETGMPIAGALIGANWVMNRPILSDDDGYFEFLGWTGEGVNDLHVTAEGYGRQAKLVPPDGDVDFALVPGNEATGRLVGPNGEPVADAFVTALASERHSGEQQIDTRSTRSSPEGTFFLTSLRTDLAHTLVVQAKGYGRYLLDFDPEFAEDGRIDLGVIELPSARAIEGTVLDEDGMPLVSHTVALAGHNSDRDRLRPGKPSSYDSTYAVSESRRTDDLGRFRFPDLSPGQYKLAVRALGRFDIIREVTLPSNNDLLDVDIVAEAGRSLTVVVKEPSGTPVENVTISVQANGRRRTRVRTDADGMAHFHGLDESDVRIHVFTGDSYERPDMIEIVPSDQVIPIVVNPAVPQD